MNTKFVILCLGLLVLPSCAWNFKRSKTISHAQECLLKKAYLYIDDIECTDCFKLIQGILSPIKGIQDVSLEKDGRVVITYDSAIKLNYKQIRMVLEEWTFELRKIEF